MRDVGARTVARIARVVFLVVIAGFVWWSLHGRFDEVVTALRDLSPAALAAALLLVGIGLAITAEMWLCILRSLGSELPRRPGFAVFFVGQLGKYVPGSVWSIGIQAHLARDSGVRRRGTVSASLVFLGVNVATAVLLGVLLAWTLHVRLPVAGWVQALVVVGAVVGLTPVVVSTLARRVAGQAPSIPPRRMAVILALMVAAWAAYALSLLVLHPHGGRALVVAFLVSYAVGVVVVFAPAGIGAREVAFVVIASPSVGVPTATAICLVSRVLFTVADLGWAAVSWLTARDQLRA